MSALWTVRDLNPSTVSHLIHRPTVYGMMQYHPVTSALSEMDSVMLNWHSVNTLQFVVVDLDNMGEYPLDHSSLTSSGSGVGSYSVSNTPSQFCDSI